MSTHKVVNEAAYAYGDTLHQDSAAPLVAGQIYNAGSGMAGVAVRDQAANANAQVLADGMGALQVRGVFYISLKLGASLPASITAGLKYGIDVSTKAITESPTITGNVVMLGVALESIADPTAAESFLVSMDPASL